MGESAQSKAAKQQYKNTGKYANFLKNEPLPENRILDYKAPFSPDQQLGNLKGIYKSGVSDVNKSFAGSLAGANRNSGARLASQGIKGGSLVEDTINRNTASLAPSKGRTLSDLGKGLMFGQNDVMKNANNFGLDQTIAGQRTQDYNQQNKYQNVLRALAMMGKSVGGLDDTTWLDDVFAAANTAGKFVGGM